MVLTVVDDVIKIDSDSSSASALYSLKKIKHFLIKMAKCDYIFVFY